MVIKRNDFGIQLVLDGGETKQIVISVRYMLLQKLSNYLPNWREIVSQTDHMIQSDENLWVESVGKPETTTDLCQTWAVIRTVFFC